MEILLADTDALLAEAQQLFREYAASLPFALDFQGFPQELASLPGDYAPPAGRLLVALVDDAVAGCVALRPSAEGVGEIKRLFVRSSWRGQAIGRRLVLAAIDEARRIGYSSLRLDTTPTMQEATRLYESLGFRPIAPYRHNPVEGATFLGLDLRNRIAVTYQTEPDLPADEFVDVLTRSTLAERRPVTDRGTILKMLANADIIVTARDGQQLVGVARAISDFSFCTYLSDLAVDQAHQGKGIGRELVRRTHLAAGLNTTLILLAAPKAQTYYPHIGMTRHESCWIIPRSVASAHAAV